MKKGLEMASGDAKDIIMDLTSPQSSVDASTMDRSVVQQGMYMYMHIHVPPFSHLLTESEVFCMYCVHVLYTLYMYMCIFCMDVTCSESTGLHWAVHYSNVGDFFIKCFGDYSCTSLSATDGDRAWERLVWMTCE